MQQEIFDNQLLENSVSKIPGLTYIPNFISSEVESELIKQIDQLEWSNELKRRVQHYGYKYNYAKKSVSREDYLGPIPIFFDIVIFELLMQKLITKRPDQVIINEYLPGQGISAHVDCVTCFEDNIISLSLGSDCEMEFCNGDLWIETNKRVVLCLERRSLILLKESARYNWTHSIKPKHSDNGIKRTRRISLTFRNVIL